MQKFDANKVGMVAGTMLGGFHFSWTVLIFLGLAQPILNFIFSLHMISPFITVLPFDPMAALELVIFTSIVGYILGYVGTMVWNMVHKA